MVGKVIRRATLERKMVEKGGDTVQWKDVGTGGT